MSFNGHAGSVTCGDFTPDGSNLSSSWHSTVMINIMHFYIFYFFSLGTLGRTICTGSDDATLRIWNPKSGESIHVVRGNVNFIL